MPKGPNGEKRPADPFQRARMIARIATGEIEEKRSTDGKDAAAVSMGKRGGAARAKALTPKKRSEIAKKAAKKRWDRP